MSQSTLDDEDLFGEAAAEMREDVEEHLAAAREELPAAADIWETNADNVLGVLNGLKSSLDVGDAREHLRQAKKWYAVGDRADAFDDPGELEDAIADVEAIVEQVADAADQVSQLASTIPELRGELEDAHSEAAEAEAD